jgi:Uma2 family endonuclease
MSTTTLIPVEDYLRLAGKPSREYRDGVLYPKAMPTKFHSIIQKVLMTMLEKQGATCYPELTLRLSQGKFLIPDVVATKDFPGDYPSDPVDLCCEILSPEDRLGTTLAKCEEYHSWGVPHCWVIDPLKRVIWQYHQDSEPTRVESTATAGPYSIDLEALFAALNPPTKK